MKINIAKPSAGTQKSLEIDDDFKCSALNGKRLGQEFDGGIISDELKGHIFKITGGNDKQGFPMKQGVLVAKRVRLLLSKGHSCYRPRRTGERKRKSVRGCIIGPDISALSLVLVKQGNGTIPGLTDCEVPCRLGPKRASNIRKLYNLSRSDDVTKYVTRREVVPRALTADDVPQEVKDKAKPYTKAPKIQRLITPVRLQRKRRIHAQKIKGIQASREKAAKYAIILAQRIKERRAKRKELHTKRRAGNSAEIA